MALRGGSILLAAVLGADVGYDRARLEARDLRQIKEYQIQGDVQGTQAHVSDDGTYIAAYVPNGVSIIHALSGKKICEVSTEGEHPHDGAISPDGRFYALGYDSPEVRVYELLTGKKVATFQVDAGYS